MRGVCVWVVAYEPTSMYSPTTTSPPSLPHPSGLYGATVGIRYTKMSNTPQWVDLDHLISINIPEEDTFISLDPHKAVGIDGIGPKFQKIVLQTIASLVQPLTL